MDFLSTGVPTSSLMVKNDVLADPENYSVMIGSRSYWKWLSFYLEIKVSLKDSWIDEKCLGISYCDKKLA